MRRELGSRQHADDGSPAASVRSAPACAGRGPIPSDGESGPTRCDEAASDAARRWYRHHRIEPLAVDGPIRSLLGCEERVYVIRQASLVQPGRTAILGGTAGDLYVTSQRLLHVGEQTVGLDLDAIGEVVLAVDGLSVTTTDGGSVVLLVDEPRLLRVQIAAARTAHKCGRKAPARARAANG
jgi:hypothetical protein